MGDYLMTITLDGTNGISAANVFGRNLIINGSGRVNQRAYVSGTATTGANQYTLDRWRVVVLGENLSFTGDESGRTMTAPAGGVEQVVESLNVVGGDYVLNWTGTATATVDGVARTKGEVFTLSANTNVIIRLTGGTFTDVQLEKGTITTPFEVRSWGQELALCQRYYDKSYSYAAAPGSTGVDGYFVGRPGVGNPKFFIANAQTMRAAPTVTFYNSVTGATGTWRSAGAVSGEFPVSAYGQSQTRFAVSLVGSGDEFTGFWTADAEL